MTRVPDKFTITDSALRLIIANLADRTGHLAYVCWKKNLAVSGEILSEGWSVITFEERENDDPVEFLGVRFLFDPHRCHELDRKSLDWIDEIGRAHV